MCDSENSARSFEHAPTQPEASERELRALLSRAHGLDSASSISGATKPGGRWHAWKRRLHDPAKRARRAARVVRHIRFVYFAHVDDDRLFGEYHHELVTAEVLLDRMLAARASGMKAVHPALHGDAEERLFTRPPRGSFFQVTPEYIRWYGRDGVRRDLPMVREELAIELMGEYAHGYGDALDIATHHSGAIPRADQNWLLSRAKTPIYCRPLHANEFLQLVKAIEAAYNVPYGDAHIGRANVEIARAAAATLGAVMDEYIKTPFESPVLAQAFANFHHAHSHRAGGVSRASSVLTLPISGVLGWFSAKRARVHAEVQARLVSR